VAAIALLVVARPAASQATALPPGNSAQQWNTIAQDTVVNTPSGSRRRRPSSHPRRHG
jgi:hypothetical protein